jgi:hypothetical protein
MQTAPITGAGAPHPAASIPISSGPQAMLAGEFSATAGGKNYGAYVEQGKYGYEATVSNVPGATATAPSVKQVEYDLGNLISFFV